MAKSKYDPDTFPLLAEGYAREGLTDKQIAKKLGISKATFYVYENKYKDFSDSIKKGKAPVDIVVENKLLQRATGYEYDEVREESTKDIETGKVTLVRVVTTTKQIVPDVTAQIFWLKNRKAEKWRDVKNLEHAGKISIEDIQDLVDDAE